MPFTLAHPAAIVPLARKGMPFSALVIGSMAPDFPYFFISSHHSHYGHTLPGLFLFCIPAGLCALWLFHGVLKLPLLWLLPCEHRERLLPPAQEFRWGPARQFALIVFALFVGVLTHLAWDSFTHSEGWTVQHIALLQVVVFRVHRNIFPVHYFLQWISTIGGMWFLVASYRRWFQTAPVQPVPTAPVHAIEHKRVVCVVIAISSLLFAAVYGKLSVQTSYISGFQQFVAHAGIGGTAAVIVELIGFSVIWHLRNARRQKLSTPAGGSAILEL